jgi:hypothetical protein
MGQTAQTGMRAGAGEYLDIGDGHYVPALNHPIYTEAEKVPKWTCLIRPIGAGDAAAHARILRRRLPEWTKRDHKRAREFWTGQAARMGTEWSILFNTAFLETHGHAPEFHDYRISGIGDDRLPESVKDRLRDLAHGQTHAKAAAEAHHYIAQHYPNLPR